MTDKLEVGQFRIWTARGAYLPLVITNADHNVVRFEAKEEIGYLSREDMLGNSRVATKLDKLLMTDNE